MVHADNVLLKVTIYSECSQRLTDGLSFRLDSRGGKLKKMAESEHSFQYKFYVHG
jgi:hypothetical protein